MMLRANLVHLETLVWISRLGTFAAAAERMNTTQSAISGRIRELESRLDIRLFEKEGRRMLLTMRARELVQRCEPLLREMEGALFSVSDVSSMAGTVRLGCGEIAALTMLPRFIGAATQSLPRIAWDIDVDLTIHLKQKLENNQLDVAIMVGPTESHTLEWSPIGSVQLVWMASTSLLQTLGKSVNELTLADAAVWTLSRPSFQYQLTAEVLRANGLAYQKINTCGHVKTLVELIRGASGVALLPNRLVEAEASDLVPVFASQLAHPIEFHAVMRRGTEDPILREIYTRAGTYRL
jgi:DNA-binding transcriptional LysR family regulator